MSELTVANVMSKIPETFTPENAAGIDTVIQYNLKGDDGGEWVVAIKDGKCTVKTGTISEPKLIFTAKAEDCLNILTGKINGMTAFMQGKIKLKGDLSLAMKLTSIFKVG